MATCVKCQKQTNELNDALVCGECWEQMDQQARLEQAFKAVVDTKRLQSELKDRMDNLKGFFQKSYEGQLAEDGTGKFVIIAETGNGVAWVKKTSSIRKGDLLKAGVDKEIIEEATGKYNAFEVF